MELYQLFDISTSVVAFFGGVGWKGMLVGAIGGVAIWLTLFILQGFGLSAMAKKRGLKKR